MNRTKIEWVKNPDGTQGFTSNPIKGYCPVACPYCYSRKDYDRYGWDKNIRFDSDEMHRILTRRKPAGIFVGSMHELFLDEYIERGWTNSIINACYLCPHLRFYLLTKQPQNLIKFSPFPDNCWVGVTATNAKMAEEAGFWLWEVKTKVKFVSFEPLLEQIPIHFVDYISEEAQGVNWVVIGAQTKPYKPPKIEWVQEIVEAADRAGIAVFLKDNLEESEEIEGYYPFYCDATGFPLHHLRQELPE